MAECWICIQKAAWKNEKINAARAAAKLQANEQGQTMAIYKEGCNYKIIASSSIPAGAKAIEHISQY